MVVASGGPEGAESCSGRDSGKALCRGDTGAHRGPLACPGAAKEAGLPPIHLSAEPTPRSRVYFSLDLAITCPD